MTPPNRTALWAETIVEECAAAGIERAVIAPGSRSTPLVVAFADHDDIETLVHPDERSAAYLAVGHGRATGRPTAVVTTSGTAVANCHPAVMEADEGRVPLVVLTADRPPELLDSGANQTTKQSGVFASAPRYERTLPEPAPEARRLRSLRVTVGRAVDAAIGPPAGPVHLDVPFSKPLEPTPDGSVPADLTERAPVGAAGRNGPAVTVDRGRCEPTGDAVDRIADALADADRPAIVVGPRGPPIPDRGPLAALAERANAPVFADPLSGRRFGMPAAFGAYDGLYAAIDAPAPDVAVRFGLSPTSKPLRQRLAAADPTQFLVDPAVEYREATFHAGHIIGADPTALVRRVTDRLDDRSGGDWPAAVDSAAATYWATVATACDGAWTAGAVVRAIVEAVPEGVSLFAGNSMPVRDIDRFARPTDRRLAVFGNRGVSGIDGLTSTALGIADADGPVVAIVGDQTALHDIGGLIAADRIDGPATIVVLNNDGGGIFEHLPIADHETFEAFFRAPHGRTFDHAAAQYDLSYRRVADRSALDAALADTDRPAIVECDLCDADSHAWRESLTERVADRVDWD